MSTPADEKPAFDSDSSRQQRESMIRTQLVPRGITDARVLEAIGRVPREWFVPRNIADRAYDDSALPIGSGQTISQPFIVAFMTNALEIRPGDTVLEIGTGSGYQAAILSHLADRVYTVERHAELSIAAGERFAALGISNIERIVGDGSLGHPPGAPYERIIVTAGAPQVPPALLEQLKPDGVLIAPIGNENGQQLIRIHKRASGTAESYLLPCRFVKLVGEQGWPHGTR